MEKDNIYSKFFNALSGMNKRNFRNMKDILQEEEILNTEIPKKKKI